MCRGARYPRPAGARLEQHEQLVVRSSLVFIIVCRVLVLHIHSCYRKLPHLIHNLGT
eukprot:SAG31_NODE_177_length_21310_cov_8.894064_2_plen_57_part_00